jgi:hypothetical protein
MIYVHDVLQDMLNPFSRIDFMLFAVLVPMDRDGKKGKYHCRSLCSLVRSCKEIVFSSKGHRSDCILHKVVVYFKPTVVEVV